MKKNYLFSAVIFLSLSFSTRGQSVCLVKDIAAAASNGNPGSLIDFNGTLFFSANDATNGTELWKSDGTDAGTVLVKDINPGNANSSPGKFCVAGNKLFFSADDGTNGIELWMTDGTSAGTVMIKNIYDENGLPLVYHSNPDYLVNLNGTVFFIATTMSEGRELWKSDGTAAGTVLVSDVYSGSSSSNPTELIVFNNEVFFSADDGTHEEEIWKTTGGGTGAALVMDVRPGGSSSCSNFTIHNNELFFTAFPGLGGAFQLWKTDGTTTAMVKDVYCYDDMKSFNGKLYFTAEESSPPYSGLELYVSDGTGAGTFRLSDINPGTASSTPESFTECNGALYFVATSSSGRELWKTDGTVAGTTIVMDINPSGNSGPENLTAFNNILYFSASDGTNGNELWRTDGTGAGTYMVEDIYPGSSSTPGNVVVSNSSLFFAASENTSGRELRSLMSAPSTSAAGITFSNVDNASMGINWTSGNGNRRVVLVKESSAVDAQPQDGVSYIADSEFGDGSELGTENYVVYDGTGNNVSITGLTASTTYHIAIYEYNGTGCKAYLTNSATIAQQATLTATSIMDEIYEDNSLLVYPNPSTSSDLIQINSEVPVLSVSVYTVQGNFIKSVEIVNNTIKGLSGMDAGSYMLLLNTAKGAVVRKIVLN